MTKTDVIRGASDGSAEGCYHTWRALFERDPTLSGYGELRSRPTPGRSGAD